jgi:hypothetical protein
MGVSSSEHYSTNVNFRTFYTVNVALLCDEVV